MKYIVTESYDSAIQLIDTIEKHLNLQKSSNTTTYAAAEEISNSSHDLSGKYVVPVSDSGWLKCDQLFDESKYSEYDASWHVSMLTSSADQ